MIKKLKKFKKAKFYDKSFFSKILNNIKGKNFFIDNLTCSIHDELLISSNFNIIKKDDPCYLFKSIKNKTEIANIKKTHIADGVALTKFLYWLKNSPVNKSEISSENFLEKLRKSNKNYLYKSFPTISGSGPNGAIIHYKASPSSNRKIKENDLYLCDSGGQYKYGTTDVTRTVCFKKQSSKIKNLYTRVLKGHIAVANSRLGNFTKGSQLDKKARYWLKQIYLDFPHSTGHGVGYFLNVHEGPQAISKKNNIQLKEGMILSNEPGYYKRGKFGIRIENLIFIKKEKNKLKFENLTLVPFENDLIDNKYLNSEEKKYISEYHLKIYEKLKYYLSFKERKWLKQLI